MQLTCPNCGAKISSKGINIQRMVAVCLTCDSVFQFDPSDTRIKRRKVKQPQHLNLDETDGQVKIAFRTNFRVDKDRSLLSGALLSAVTTFVTAALFAKYLVNSESIFMVAGFGLATLMCYYWLALVAFNKTHIVISDEKIKVSRNPLPNILTRANTISLSGIENIRYEETAASKKEGYDTPRYHIWGETVDGRRSFIVGDVVESYAVFISQRLNEFLNPSATPDLLRVLDQDDQVNESELENEQLPDRSPAMSAHSESSHP